MSRRPPDWAQLCRLTTSFFSDMKYLEVIFKKKCLCLGIMRMHLWIHEVLVLPSSQYYVVPMACIIPTSVQNVPSHSHSYPTWNHIWEFTVERNHSVVQSVLSHSHIYPPWSNIWELTLESYPSVVQNVPGHSQGYKAWKTILQFTLERNPIVAQNVLCHSH